MFGANKQYEPVMKVARHFHYTSHGVTSQLQLGLVE